MAGRSLAKRIARSCRRGKKLRQRPSRYCSLRLDLQPRRRNSGQAHKDKSTKENQMTLENQLIFGAFIGACAMAAINLAVQDQLAYADQHEKELCKDKGDMTALMARLPGESHSVEV